MMYYTLSRCDYPPRLKEKNSYISNKKPLQTQPTGKTIQFDFIAYFTYLVAHDNPTKYTQYLPRCCPF